MWEFILQIFVMTGGILGFAILTMWLMHKFFREEQ